MQSITEESLCAIDDKRKYYDEVKSVPWGCKQM